MKDRELREIDQIIVHCSDSDYPEHDDVSVIRQWHLQRGWQDVGYHFVICKKENGLIQKGRPMDLIGAHCKGHNRNSLGICLTGKNLFSMEQFNSLRGLMANIRAVLPAPKLTAFPHHHYNHGKTCPNFSKWSKEADDHPDSVNSQIVLDGLLYYPAASPIASIFPETIDVTKKLTLQQESKTRFRGNLKVTF